MACARVTAASSWNATTPSMWSSPTAGAATCRCAAAAGVAGVLVLAAAAGVPLPLGVAAGRRAELRSACSGGRG